jgi:hypothetical protein
MADTLKIRSSKYAFSAAIYLARLIEVADYSGL